VCVCVYKALNACGHRYRMEESNIIYIRETG
jgi:hypothetical protein